MSDASDDAVRMEIKALLMDPASKTPIVVLRDEAGELFLPIWIGIFEANAIALGLEAASPARPMTHDLLHQSLLELGAGVEKITISDLRDNTFFATIRIHDTEERGVDLDCRPSDAIALAIRAQAPIYVLRSVLESARATDLVLEGSDEDRLREWLDSIDPSDLGKYKM